MKTILVTGCRGGMGRDAAEVLARLGHKVIATVHGAESVPMLQRYSDERGLGFEVFKLDITLPEDRQKIAGRNIDVLVNNAAMGESGSLADVPLERLRANFETNVFSTIALSQLALGEMLTRGSGRVVFISSLAGRAVAPFMGPYCMTKFALSAAVDVLRQELSVIAKNVHVAVVEPGAYATGFNQRTLGTKFQWMNESSPFWKVLPEVKEREDKTFAFAERKTNVAIVRKIVRAVEDEKPKPRYTAPWWQAWYVWWVRAMK